MVEVRYVYGPEDNAAGYNTEQLEPEIVAAGLPAAMLYGSGYPAPGATICPTVHVGFDPDITAGQKATLDGVIAAHAPAGPRQPRTVYAISYDIFTKTTGAFNPAATGQKLLIINDMFTGNIATGGQRWQQDPLRNGAALVAVYASVMKPDASATFNPAQQLVMTAMYCQDFPNYLVHPSFDPTINIPGDQPA